MKNSYQYTKFLVVVGILLMGVSYINFKKFEGLEIYPFFGGNYLQIHKKDLHLFQFTGFMK